MPRQELRRELRRDRRRELRQAHHRMLHRMLPQMLRQMLRHMLRHASSGALGLACQPYTSPTGFTPRAKVSNSGEWMQAKKGTAAGA
eukprot:CAMPEP_0168383400 /NCGR_PEP_ID=MMETSP0228-20121227/13883_1 /TAXON_ID=133427 /ORGANISM="Protoceratium reticulatum, Strain CCCM 535 (=CCMP 1889)" /LENGTH=86 /DNA_ID=CAMNT_0008396549 /DNA_START=1128 /DNA_END=1388 /DNA_ORIENTATION=-